MHHNDGLDMHLPVSDPRTSGGPVAPTKAFEFAEFRRNVDAHIASALESCARTRRLIAASNELASRPLGITHDGRVVVR